MPPGHVERASTPSQQLRTRASVTPGSNRTMMSQTASPAFAHGLPTAAHPTMPGIFKAMSSASFGHTLEPPTRLLPFMRSTIPK